MDGTFTAAGVQCESCHGPGRAHVASLDKNDITKIATARTTTDLLADDMGYGKAVTCGECHTRDGEKDYPTYVSAFNTAFPTGPAVGGRIDASGGLAEHHEQYDEMLGVDPDTGAPLGKHLAAKITCISCHDPHKTTKYQDQAGESGLVADCVECHGSGKLFEVAMPTISGMSGLECIDCHMPRLSKSAIKHDAVGTGPATGDIRTHIFKIDLSKTAQTTTDGKYVYPWLTKNFACLTCHNGVDEFDLSTVDVSAYLYHQTTTPTITNVAALANSFAGAATCAGCHPENYSNFIKSGHPFKLNKVVNDQMPTYPFSTIAGALALLADDNGETDNTLGTPTSYADISYVIGGYGWKARWIDKDGFIVTGSEVQYNLADGSMVDYRNDAVDVPYNCGNCHTTGWRHYDAVLNPNRQDNLPGMDGTFAAAGVQCEACHGDGLLHMLTGNPDYITKIATARTTENFTVDNMAQALKAACSECHTRDGEKDYPTYVSAAQLAGYTGNEGGRIAASGGFAKHHEQYDELLGLDPDDLAGGPLGKHLLNGVTCISCHTPHATTKYQDDPTNTSSEPGVEVDCIDCHDMTFTITDHASVECIDCHMPRASKSAIKTDSELGADTFGDIRNHIFKIDLSKDPATEQFSGSFMRPWLTRNFACGACHADPATEVGTLNTLHGGLVH